MTECPFKRIYTKYDYIDWEDDEQQLKPLPEPETIRWCKAFKLDCVGENKCPIMKK